MNTLRIHFLLLIILLVTNHGFASNISTKRGLYLIIVSDDYKQSSSLSEFKKFRETDFDVQIVNGSSIGTTKDEYRNYIRNLMPDYVLLVGKYGDFPTHTINYRSKVESYNYYVASSLSDYPNLDIPLGLFFAENEAELANIVSKIISYENNLSRYPKTYYAHAGSNEALAPWPVTFNEEILTEMSNAYYKPNGYHFSLSTANDSTANDTWTDINMINAGIHFMIYHGHGMIYKWKFGLGVGGLSQLTNSIYPIIFSFACLTGSFSGEIDGIKNDCFAQKMVGDKHGAVAFLGAYNVAGHGMNLLLEGVTSGLFTDSFKNRLGDVLIRGFSNTRNSNTVNQYYPTVTLAERTRTAWQFHLFGDPALKIRNQNDANSKEIVQDKDIPKIYPNPAKEQITISGLPENFSGNAKIYNGLGQNLSLVNGKDKEFNIPVKNFSKGVYIVKLKSVNGDISTGNFIKE